VGLAEFSAALARLDWSPTVAREHDHVAEYCLTVDSFMAEEGCEPAGVYAACALAIAGL
jgi:hypothetical protein